MKPLVKALAVTAKPARLAQMAEDKNKSNKSTNSAVLATNRKASFEYHLLTKFEAGMVLTGNEIKSMRAGGMSLNEAYVRVSSNEVFLVGAHIKEYSHSSATSYDPIRPRKLLLHEAEINKLRAQTTTKGLTIIPIRVYLKSGRAKLEVALARHKNAPDKRRDVIAREKKLEAGRAMKQKV